MRVCVCVSVCPSVDTYGRIFLRFSPNLTQTSKSKNEFVGGKYRFTLPLFPHKNPHFDPEVLKTHAKMKNAMSALNVHESPKFPRLMRNRGRGTR